MLDPSLPISEQLAELEPEELRYLRELCKFLRAHPLPPSGDSDFEFFDPDELGLDPEADYERW